MSRGVLRRRRMPGAPERGTIAPLALTAVLLLFAVLAFSVDQGIACAAKVRQENAVDAARDACFDASFALMAKNADDPGLAVARRIAESLRSAGFSGAATVWFFEVPKEDLPASRRVWGMAVQLQEQVPTVFARGYGIEGLPVASYRVLTAMPYAGEKVWRPETRRCGRYDYPAGATADSWTYEALNSLDAFPAELAEAARATLAESGK